jgi:hypothetical protein
VTAAIAILTAAATATATGERRRLNTQRDNDGNAFRQRQRHVTRLCISRSVTQSPALATAFSGDRNGKTRKEEKPRAVNP